MSTLINDNLTIAVLTPVALAILALILVGYQQLVLRKHRRDQKVILGGGKDRDLLEHANAVQRNVDGLARDLTDLAARLEHTGERLDDCLTFRSVMRYDAYNDLSGMQSTSVALLDTRFSGIIISSIQSRDHARIYVKEVRHGDSKEKLSPEEIQVLKEAMGLKSHRFSDAAAGGADG